MKVDLRHHKRSPDSLFLISELSRLGVNRASNLIHPAQRFMLSQALPGVKAAAFARG